MDLDAKITEIFDYLVNTGLTYITKINYYSYSIDYNLNGRTVSLKICRYPKKQGLRNKFTTLEDIYPRSYPIIDFSIPENELKLVFRLDIDGKEYFIPELPRVKKAIAIESLEKTIQEYERKVLKDLL